MLTWCSYHAPFTRPHLPCDASQRSCSVMPLPLLAVLCYTEAKEVKMPLAKVDLQPWACGHSAVPASIPLAGQPVAEASMGQQGRRQPLGDGVTMHGNPRLAT